MNVIYPKLKVKEKRKFVNALRSGKFKQSNIPGFLKIATITSKNKIKMKYCCLGVLGEIMNIPQTCDKIILEKEKISHFEFGSKKNGDISYIPKYYANKIGLEEFDSDNKNNVQFILAQMNDNGKSFNKIANWIEKNL